MNPRDGSLIGEVPVLVGWSEQQSSAAQSQETLALAFGNMRLLFSLLLAFGFSEHEFLCNLARSGDSTGPE